MHLCSHISINCFMYTCFLWYVRVKQREIKHCLIVLKGHQQNCPHLQFVNAEKTAKIQRYAKLSNASIKIRIAKSPIHRK